MNARRIARAISATLWFVFLVLFVATKIHFFTRYSKLGIGYYLQEHAVYWAGMAATVFIIWLISMVQGRKVQK